MGEVQTVSHNLLLLTVAMRDAHFLRDNSYIFLWLGQIWYLVHLGLTTLRPLVADYERFNFYLYGRFIILKGEQTNLPPRPRALFHHIKRLQHTNVISDDSNRIPHLNFWMTHALAKIVSQFYWPKIKDYLKKFVQEWLSASKLPAGLLQLLPLPNHVCNGII